MSFMITEITAYVHQKAHNYYFYMINNNNNNKDLYSSKSMMHFTETMYIYKYCKMTWIKQEENIQIKANTS